ncbi:hypothetical protein D5085_09115 [Ectothiorhodospiraceae bacterium BW-2]|nr:hypothetical protein D5085_09115 [Ectothiorhodospiraceae bacterium BW-2]
MPPARVNFLCYWLLLLLSASSGAILANTELNFEQLYSELNQLEQQLQSAPKTPENFTRLWQESETIRRQATDCVSQHSTQQQQIEADLTLLGSASVDEELTLRRARRDLERRQKSVEQRLTGCRLILVKSETIQQQSEAWLNENQTETLLQRQANIFELLTLEQISQLRHYLLAQPIQWQQLRLDELSITATATLTALSLLALLLYLYWRSRPHPPPLDADTATLTQRGREALTLALSRYRLPLLLFLGWFLFWLTLSYLEPKWLPLAGLNGVILGYFILLTTIHTLLTPLPPLSGYLPFPTRSVTNLGRALHLTGVIVALWAGLLFLPYQVPVPELLEVSVRIAMAITLITGLIWLVWLIFSLKARSGPGLIRMATILVLIGTASAEIVGYRHLSSYMLLGMSASLALTALGWLGSYLISDFIDGLENSRYRWQQQLQQRLDIGTDTWLPGLFWFRLGLNLLLWLFVAFLLLQIWQISHSEQAKLFSYLSDGFTLGSVTIVPGRILIAIGVLAILLSAIAWFKRQLEEN